MAVFTGLGWCRRNFVVERNPSRASQWWLNVGRQQACPTDLAYTLIFILIQQLFQLFILDCNFMTPRQFVFLGFQRRTNADTQSKDSLFGPFSLNFHVRSQKFPPLIASFPSLSTTENKTATRVAHWCQLTRIQFCAPTHTRPSRTDTAHPPNPSQHGDPAT